MAASTESVVQEWLNVIRIATDNDSPFRGMVDLQEIFSLPLPTQQAIFDRLSDEEKYRLGELYGSKNSEGGK